MSKIKNVKTIGYLKASGYKTVTVREEIRRNLINKLKKGQNIFKGIIGYDDTVIPQIENAILSGQDIIFLGERGQAKSRIMRQLISLLDDYIPVIKGCEINDNPFAPICRSCKEKMATNSENVEISWLSREERINEKLATPDITIADLIGDVDPIKVAEGRYLGDELTIHYGLIPRTNRGIFCINELPELAERIQVGLFNLMEERDIQIRGYRVRLPLDVYILASANPEDYTNRGTVITPLKDRFGAQIRTHYPCSIRAEIEIVELEKHKFKHDRIKTYVPEYMKEIIAEFTHLARKNQDINQRSGVSVRLSIANYETIVGNAIRRSIKLHENMAVPRISDLPYIFSSTIGKIEIESLDENRDNKIVEDLLKRAVVKVFNRFYHIESLQMIVEQFAHGFTVEVSDSMSARSYLRNIKEIINLEPVLKGVDFSESPEVIASALEFMFEGLHLNRKLNKTTFEGKSIYKV